MTGQHDVEAMRLLCAIFESRTQRIVHNAASREGWLGERCDDTWVRINRFRAWWHCRRGTHPQEVG